MHPFRFTVSVMYLEINKHDNYSFFLLLIRMNAQFFLIYERNPVLTLDNVGNSTINDETQ